MSEHRSAQEAFGRGPAERTEAPRARIDYDGRRFRALGGHDGTCAEYHQCGELVWAVFEGGHVRRGAITGTCDERGVLRLAYTMVLATGEVIAGHSTNTPQRHGDTLVLREVWERYGEHAATGVSYLEEVPAVEPAGAAR